MSLRRTQFLCLFLSGAVALQALPPFVWASASSSALRSRPVAQDPETVNRIIHDESLHGADVAVSLTTQATAEVPSVPGIDPVSLAIHEPHARAWEGAYSLLHERGPAYQATVDQIVSELLELVDASRRPVIYAEVRDIVALIAIGWVAYSMTPSTELMQKQLSLVLGHPTFNGHRRILEISNRLLGPLEEVSKGGGQTPYDFLTPSQQEMLKPIIDDAIPVRVDRLSNQWRLVAAQLAREWLTWSNIFRNVPPDSRRLARRTLTSDAEDSFARVGMAITPAIAQAIGAIWLLAERQPIFIDASSSILSLSVPKVQLGGTEVFDGEVAGGAGQAVGLSDAAPLHGTDAFGGAVHTAAQVDDDV